MVCGIPEIVRAIGDAVPIHVIVLVGGIAVVVVILSGGMIPMAAGGIGTTWVSQNRCYQYVEDQEEGQEATHKIRSFQGQFTGNWKEKQ